MILASMPSRLLLLHVGAAAALATRAVNMARFEEMLSACVLPPAAIEVIDDPCAHTHASRIFYPKAGDSPTSLASRLRRKMRTLFRGVSAAAEQPVVRNAFSIVYQDLGPIRVAGDLIFNKLKRIASEADTRIAGLEELQTADSDALTAARTLFDVVDEDASGGLTREELLASPVLLELLRSGRSKTVDDEELVDVFLAEADVDGDGEITFVEFALATASGSGRLRIADEAVTATIDEFRSREAAAGDADGGGAGLLGRRRANPRRKRKTHGERFDEMLATCLGWEAAYLCRGIPTDAPIEDLEGCATEEAAEEAAAIAEQEGKRLQQVLLGTFAGGRSEPVALALRVCYEEYSPLRFGGDLIFRVLKTVVRTTLNA